MSLIDAPTLDQLIIHPDRVAELPVEVASSILAKLAGIQSLLLARVLAGRGNGGQPECQPDRLLTAEEVADRLHVPRDHVYELCRRRELPSVKIGKYVRVSGAALTKWLGERGA